MAQRIRLLFIAGLAALAFGLVSHTAAAAGQKLRFVFVSHAPDSDSWWNTVKNGIKVAAEQTGVEVEYRNPPNGDLATMARLIEQAAASHPDGIISTIADFNVIGKPLIDAVRRGIPVITVNSGTPEQSEQIGALMHIGQPDYTAGVLAGERAKKDGIHNFVCVNHYITNSASVERCAGFAKGLGIALGSQMIDSGTDPTVVESKVEAYLRANPKTEAVLALGPLSAIPTIAALKAMHMAGHIYFGTFDLSSEIVAGIKDGTVSWAIDQQPYLQGYLPVVFLANYDRYGVIPADKVILTGPGFVTKANVDLVEKYAGTYR